ncbi:MAG: CDP-alcohol phosphatidyltransferase family protein, partial [Beijerinckiaceae bacterium]|nr:CDP-alcohol phosphatidyltransferase family protein [Beijerinckiaceae bacterium]
MTLPNLITVARLLMVPLAIMMILDGRWMPAFLVFALAGLSDAVDGYLARRFAMASDLGAYLDPIADKALIVSIYVTLAL